MARGEGQKLKIMILRDLLERESDENHPVSVQRMIQVLAEHDIPAERKAIYDDILCLKEYGLDILHKPGRGGGYFLASRFFELAELKLLVDAVQSSKFLTSKKSMELIGKLSAMASIHDAGTLKRQVSVSGRVKTMNESIYYNVDRLHEAIAKNAQIHFSYWEWGADGKRHQRPGIYVASPYELVYDSENYYLVAHSARHGITHYRVDKMAAIEILDTPRTPPKDLPPATAYGRSVFGMYGSQTTRVRLRFHSSLAGVVLDRFGCDTMLIPDGPDHFIFSDDIAVSPIFLGWVASFGPKAQILSPQPVIRQFRQLCADAAGQYSVLLD